jgi:hypothetical protein
MVVLVEEAAAEAAVLVSNLKLALGKVQKVAQALVVLAVVVVELVAMVVDMVVLED